MEKENSADSNVVANAPQAKPENKPTANVITDNLRSAADQSNLNPDADVSDTVAPGGLINMGSGTDHGIKLPAPFKNAEDAVKHIGEQILVTAGGVQQTATLFAVSAKGVEAPQHFHYKFSQAYPWNGKEAKQMDDFHKGDKAWDVDAVDAPEDTKDVQKVKLV